LSLTISSSAAGEVFVATNSKTNELVAIKKMPINAENIKLLCTEIDIMRDSKHAGIVEYIDSFIVDDNQLWVVMEYMDGGCLTDVLEQYNDRVQLTEGQIARICLETLNALQYIHSKHRIHRDIKSDNILLNLKGDVKIGAFHSGHISPHVSHTNSPCLFSRFWIRRTVERTTKEEKHCRWNSILDGT
jgi:serine/threonine protein kinase